MPHLTRRRLVKARARLPRCALCLRPMQVSRNGYPWCPSDKTYATHTLTTHSASVTISRQETE